MQTIVCHQRDRKENDDKNNSGDSDPHYRLANQRQLHHFRFHDEFVGRPHCGQPDVFRNPDRRSFRLTLHTIRYDHAAQHCRATDQGREQEQSEGTVTDIQIRDLTTPQALNVPHITWSTHSSFPCDGPRIDPKRVQEAHPPGRLSTTVSACPTSPTRSSRYRSRRSAGTPRRSPRR